MNNIKNRLMKLEYLNEVCIHSPSLLIDTKCGIARYKFNKIGYENNQLVIECKLLMDSNNRDVINILYRIKWKVPKRSICCIYIIILFKINIFSIRNKSCF